MSQEKTVKVSICPKCGNYVTLAAWDIMDNRSKSDFSKEVVNNDLIVKTMPLSEYKALNIIFCKCKK